jgi:hypothetical protein
MEVFDIIVGIFTIVSCLISIYACYQVEKIKKKIDIDFNINKSKVDGSIIIQSGKETKIER